MKYLVLLMAVLLTACATAPSSVPIKTSNNNSLSENIHITGLGKTFEEAKQNGFKKAIEFVVGSVIVSEKQAVDDKLVKNEILDYSGGYIDNYKILSQYTHDGLVELSMNVTVKSSHIAEMILGKKTKSDIDGQNLATKYYSLMNLRDKQLILLNNVLKNYYDQGMIYDDISLEFTYDSDRNLIVGISFTRSANQNYYKALKEVLDIIKDTDSKKGNLVRLSRNPKNSTWWPFTNTNDIFYINDNQIYNTITSFWAGNTMYKFLDKNNNVLYIRCSEFPWHILSGDIYKFESYFELKFNKNHKFIKSLSDLDHVEIQGIGWNNIDQCQR